MMFPVAYLVLLSLSAKTYVKSAVIAPNAVLRIYDYDATVESGSGTPIILHVTEAHNSEALALEAALRASSQVSPIPDACSQPSYNPCHEFATCRTVNAAYGIVQCKCNAGYNQTASFKAFQYPNSTIIPDGTYCPDIDECTSAIACGPATQNCTNSIGDFTCTCNTGYTLIRRICDTVDECSVSTLNNCNANAACINIPDSYTCVCNAGYTGDGFDCTEINECTANSITCGDSGTCVASLGVAYSCTCDDGYIVNTVADPMFCFDFNECTRTPCDSNAACANTEGSYSCTCNTGFNGDGITCTKTTTAASTQSTHDTTQSEDLNPPESSAPSSGGRLYLYILVGLAGFLALTSELGIVD